MDPERFTTKSSQAINAAQELAVRHGHTEVDTEHLLAALLEQDGGFIPRVLERAGVELSALTRSVKAELSRKPGVSGAAASMPTPSRRLSLALQEAMKHSQKLNDE